MQNSILSTSNIKFLDSFGKELSNININIEGFSLMNRDKDDLYFLHKPIEDNQSTNSSNKDKLPTINVKYDINSNTLSEFKIPDSLKNLNLTTLTTTYNEDVIAIYDKSNSPSENINKENIVYNLTTNEIINENLYNVTSVEKINYTYYILSYVNNAPTDQGYNLLALNTKNQTMSITRLDIPFNNDTQDNKTSPLKYNLLVLNDKLHILSPNGTLSVFNNNTVTEVAKLNSGNVPEFVSTVKSNGDYAYISLQDSIYNKNSTTKKYLVIDKNYKIRQITDNVDIILDDSTVKLYKDKISIFTQDSKAKELENAQFYLINYNLDTLQAEITDLTSLYKLSDNKKDSFIPSNPIDIEKY